MAAGTLSQPRRKPITYGKSSRNSAKQYGRIDAIIKDSPTKSLTRAPDRKLGERAPSSQQETTSMLEDYDVPSSEEESRKPGNAQESQARPSLNEFDVPGSEDEMSTPRATRTATHHPRTARLPTTSPARTAKVSTAEVSKKRKREVPVQTRVQSPEVLKAEAVTSPSPRAIVSVGADRQMPMGTTMTKKKHTMVVRTDKTTSSGAAQQLSSRTAARPSILLVEDGAVAVNASARPHPVSVVPKTPVSSPRKAMTSDKIVSTTPKQNDLWSQLLPPGKRSIADQEPEGEQKVSSNNPHESTVSSETVQSNPRRRRIADQLKSMQHKRISDAMDDLEESDDAGNASKDDRLVPGVRKQPSFLTSEHTDSQGASQSDAVRQEPKLTYARTRSYLQEENFEADLLLAMPTETPFKPSKTQGSAFEMAEDSDEDQSQGLRNIHELRAAGNRKRFADDIDTLLDDIKDHARSSWSRRRGALMEISTKLREKSFVARFIQSGYDHHLVAECKATTTANGLDVIADTMLLILLITLLSFELPKHSLDSFAHTGVLDWMTTQLSKDTDMARVARDRQHNMSKASQAGLMDFLEGFRDTPIWNAAGSGPWTQQVLALRTMENMVVKIRKSGQRRLLLGRPEIIDELVRLESASTVPYVRELALSTLEAESVAYGSGGFDRSTIWSATALVRLASSLPSWLSSTLSNHHNAAVALRLCLNVTNNDEHSCDQFAQTAVLSSLLQHVKHGFGAVSDAADETQRAQELDNLLLALGLLINLAEHSDEVRNVFVTSSPTALSSLVQIFAEGQERAAEAESIEQTQSNVAHGYLAVLIGNMCLNNNKVKAATRKLMPDQDLRALVRAIREFVQYNQEVDSQVSEGDESQRVWTTFTDRLTAVATRLQDA